MADIKEDPDERRMFDEAVRLYGGSPLRQMAGALTIWHQMAPEHGSYGKTLAIYANECARAANVIDGEREARHKLEAALTAKDKAMGVLFERLTAAGVDCSDLIS